MENEILISVIVPVHNTEKYLHKCIQSIANQTYKDIEILCIDSSTDESCNILEEWKNKDKRIKVIYDANGSYGHKINMGISEACGEFISIIDSDDMMSECMLNSLYNIIKDSELDFVKSDYSRFHEENGNMQIDEYSKCLMDDSYYDKMIELQRFPEILWKSNICIWTGLYRTSFLKEKQIFLHESHGASFQDCGFAVLTTLLSQKVFYLSKSFYRYRIDNAGSSVKDESKIMTLVDEWEWIEKEIEKRNVLNDRISFCLKAKKIVTYYWNYMRLQRENASRFACGIHDELDKEYVCNSRYHFFDFEVREMLFEMFYSNEKSVKVKKAWAEKEGISLYYTKPDKIKCSVIIWEDNKYSGGDWEKTLLSIFKQDVKELEIWVLCSRQNELIKYYQECDARINIVELLGDKFNVWDQINNTIQNIHGEYVFFSTNTERLYDGTLAKLLQIAKKEKSDLLLFDAEIFDLEPYDGIQLPYLSYYKHDESYGHIDNKKCMQINMLKSPWCDLVIPILVKRNLIKNNHILFEKNVISAKRLFEAKVIMCADMVFQINDKLMCKEVQYLTDLC